MSLVVLDIGLPASSAADAPLSSGTFLIHLRDKGEGCPRPPSAPPPVRIPYRDAGKDWRDLRDSNPQPPDPKSGALSVELRARSIPWECPPGGRRRRRTAGRKSGPRRR